MRIPMNHVQRLFFSFSLLCSSIIQATVQLGGNNGTTSTYNFTIGPTASFIPAAEQVYAFVTGQSAVAGANNYAVAVGLTAGTYMNPASPATTSLNGVTGSVNPLYNAVISKLALAGQFPVLTVGTAGSLNRVYAIQSYVENYSKTLQSDALKDANGVVDGGAIAGIATTQNLLTAYASQAVPNFVYSLVPEAGQAFGAFGTNSGIASTSFEVGTYPASTMTVYDASTGAVGNVAYAFNATSAAVGGAQIATNTDNQVAIYYHPWLNVGYVAMPVTAGATGARAVSLLQLTGGKVNAVALAPTTNAVAYNTKIFATGTGSVYASRLSGMYTSTRLPYLIMLGGNSGVTYNKTVYALPLVNSTVNGATVGTIANPAFVDSTQIRARYFTNAATTDAQLYSNTAVQAVVGRGALPLPDSAGNATVFPTSMYAVGDAVYASIDQAYTGPVAPGIFNSHAIFQANGVIANWTPWTRASGTNSQIAGSGYDASVGQMWYATSGANANVNHTEWQSPANDGLVGSLVAYVSQQLVSPTGQELTGPLGGTQGMASFSAGRTGFVAETSGIENADTTIFTGFGRVIFAYTGARAQAGAATDWTKPLTGNYTTNLSVNANDTFPTPLLADRNPFTSTYWTYDITGPVLASLGPIDAIDTVASGTSRWIAVGGVNGVAILQNNDGSGWTYGAGNYPYGLSFKSFGNWNFVKKLFSDGTYLYVLTKDRLDRVTLSANFPAAAPVVTTLATAQNITGCICGGLMDAIVTGQLALVGTTNGLFRSGNGVDITAAGITPVTGAQWQEVLLPEGIKTIDELTFASPNNAMSGIKDGGQVYVMDSYTGYYQARIHRLYINIDGGVVSNTTVQPIDDYFVPDKNLPTGNIPSYFVNFGGFRDHWYTDGTIDLNTRPLNAPNPPLELTVPEQVYASEGLPPTAQDLPRTTPMGGLLLPGGYRYGVPLAVDYSVNVINQKQSFYSRLVRNEGSGALFVGGDYGLFVNE